jgi:hypothetical protein
MGIANVESIVAGGESEAVEGQKSTAQLARCREALCAFFEGKEVRR